MAVGDGRPAGHAAGEDSGLLAASLLLVRRVRDLPAERLAGADRVAAALG